MYSRQQIRRGEEVSFYQFMLTLQCGVCFMGKINKNKNTYHHSTSTSSI